MRHDRLKGDLKQQSQLRRAVKVNEVAWSEVDRALEAFGPSDAVFVAGRRPLTYDRDPILVEGR